MVELLPSLRLFVGPVTVGRGGGVLWSAHGILASVAVEWCHSGLWVALARLFVSQLHADEMQWPEEDECSQDVPAVVGEAGHGEQGDPACEDEEGCEGL